MNNYLEDLYQAFENVNERYYFTEVFRDPERFYEEKDKVIQSTENSFSAELFRHWRNIMEQGDKIEQYENLSIDFDIRKSWFDEKIITSRTQSYRPDLTLHKSQIDWDPEYQRVYVEVKTNPTPYVKDDIQKLANALERLHFDRGVFISVNSNYNNLIQLLKPILISENRRLGYLNFNIEWNRVYLFHSIINNQTRSISKPISFQQIIDL